MYNKTKQIFVASLVALALVGMNCSNSNDGDSGGSGSNGSGGGSSTVAVTGVSLDKTSEVIDVDGGSTTLTATVLPSNASNQAVTWKSSDNTVATIDPNGKVTAVKVGTATVTVTTDDGGFTASATITVKPVVVTGVSLNTASKTIYRGDSTMLTATITPINASNTDVTWKSSDNTVATVDPNGKVTAVKVGTATITVITEDGGFTASAIITIPAAVTFKTVVSSNGSSYAISTDGKLYAWGYNKYGQLGDDSTTNRSTPKEIMAGIKTVVSSGSHTLAISTGGKLYAWGDNYFGQLGDGTTTNSFTPKEIMTDTTFKTVVAVGSGRDNASSYAISTDGKLYAWGYNKYGQLGDDSTTNRSTPQEIMAGIKTVVATGFSSYAISTDDKLYAWGDNYSGQLGNRKGGYGEKEVTPQEIMAGIKTVVASGSHTLAISTGGKLYAWGENKYGQLGNGTIYNRYPPTEIMTGIKTVVGSDHTLAINTYGKLYAWGWNYYGQLGDNTTTNSSTPKEIMAGATFQTVVASYNSSYAISTDGKLYTWGGNKSGQLGDGSTDNRNTPKEIMAGIKTVVASGSHTLAISTDDKLYAWGSNYYGQLGDGKGGWGEKEVTPQLIEVYE